MIHIGDGATPDGLSSYEALIAATAPKPDAKRNGPDLAGVFYADGTTGFPKGVMLRHQALALNALFTARERPANQGRRGVRPTPLYAPEVGHFRIEGDHARSGFASALQCTSEL